MQTDDTTQTAEGDQEEAVSPKSTKGEILDW